MSKKMTKSITIKLIGSHANDLLTVTGNEYLCKLIIPVKCVTLLDSFYFLFKFYFLDFIRCNVILKKKYHCQFCYIIININYKYEVSFLNLTVTFIFIIIIFNFAFYFFNILDYKFIVPINFIY